MAKKRTSPLPPDKSIPKLNLLQQGEESRVFKSQKKGAAHAAQVKYGTNPRLQRQCKSLAPSSSADGLSKRKGRSSTASYVPLCHVCRPPTFSFPYSGNPVDGLLFLIEVQLIYNVVLVSGVQYSYSVTYTHTHIYLLSQLLFHYRLLQNFQYNSLFYTVGPCCLFYIQQYIFVYVNPKLLIYPSPFSL